MARYERIFTLKENINENINCPVKLVVGALLKDTEKNELLAQLKFTNISDQTIESIEVDIITYDANGQKALPIKGYVYNGLSAGFKDSFGEKTPVKINDKNTISFEVNITQVTNANGILWNGKKDNVTESMKKASEEMTKLVKAVGDETTKAAKKFGDESTKVVEKTAEKILDIKDRVITVVGAVINTVIFVELVLLCCGGAISVLEGSTQEEKILLGIVIAATIISCPIFGHLLKKYTKGKKLRIARWIIILMLFVGAVIVSENVYPVIDAWEGSGEQITIDGEDSWASEIEEEGSQI